MKNIIKVLLLIPAIISAQIEYEIFPGSLNVQPFTANFLEPRVGVLAMPETSELRLDIGNSLDLVHVKPDKDMIVSFGADFFTYTSLRSEQAFHFPVDAVDYLFGINMGFKKSMGEDEFGTRFRISHISAHFVDGHYTNSTNSWRDGQKPRVYSREFVELIPYYRMNDLRFYLGYTYIFHTDPGQLGRHIMQLGSDYFYKDFPFKNFNPFVAYDMRLLKIDKYSANNTISAGIKYGFSKGKGLSIYYSYFQGKSIHGEYFDFNKNYSSIGFNLDL